MNKYILNRIVKISLGLAIIVYLVFIYFFNINILSKDGILKIPTLFTIIIGFWTFYISLGWKIPIIRNLAFVENLNGTWLGTYNSTNVLNEMTFQGDIAIVIKQNFLGINIKSYTENYVNHSYGEAIDYNNKSEKLQLLYLYSQDEFKSLDEISRKGATDLQLLMNFNEKKLFGKFWTNHNSQGSLNLTRRSKKQAKSYNEAISFLEKSK